jgi:hypothetical protein
MTHLTDRLVSRPPTVAAPRLRRVHPRGSATMGDGHRGGSIGRGRRRGPPGGERVPGVPRGTVDRDWTRRIQDLEWTVAQAVAHIGESLLWYATDLAAGPRELSAMDLSVRPETAPPDLVAVLGSYVRHRPRPGDRRRRARSAWLASGRSRRHLRVRGHGLRRAAGAYRGRRPRAGPVVHPVGGAERGDPPAPVPVGAHRRRPVAGPAVANGRVDLPGQERQTGWRWHCAPLAEWDGVNPLTR